MDKIYSRKRIKIPQIITYTKKENPKNIKKFIKVLTIIFIAITTMGVIIKSVTPIYDTLCINKAKSIATMVSNEKATEVMKNYEYEDLVEVMKDSNDKVNMIKYNVVTINKIISDVAIEIQKELDKLAAQNIEIAIGSFSGIRILAGLGPKVKIRISPIGNVETNYTTEFKAQGINQTIHKIYLEVKCNVNILTPYKDIESTITNQVILAENIIVGEIPNTYYNLEGLDSQNMIDVIE